MPNQRDYWKNSGFVEMVAPLRLPSNRQGTDIIQVWLKLPENRKITAYRINDSREDRYTLVYPPGTIADRVEFDSPIYGVGDVRGARIDENGSAVFHVFEPAPGVDYHQLAGYEWARKDDVADVAAGEALVALFYPRANEAIRNQFRQSNHCGACHQQNAPAPVSTAAPFRYMSDVQGFFQPIAVLQDTMTVRNHRAADLNANDRFITVYCGNQPTRAKWNDWAIWYECPQGQVPVGKLDMASALQAKDPHAIQVCEARAYLYRHMDEKARAAFAPAFAECSQLAFKHP
ncbi:MAG: hypothetical protein ACJ763_19205 [Bdellovibrionia bacterium]